MIFGTKRIEALEAQLETHMYRLDSLSGELRRSFENLQSQIISLHRAKVTASVDKKVAQRLKQREYAREYYRKNKAVINARTVARRKVSAKGKT
jgi:hypothetical protein